MQSHDIFVSYSRRDNEDGFVTRLKTSLESDGLRVWMDDKIVSSAEWWAQIQLQIERSDNFLLLISDSSLASEWCQKEIAHALLHGKRIIPFQLSALDEQRVRGGWLDQPWEQIARANWDPLRRIQWITSYVAVPDFGEAVARISADARINPGYVAAHTQLLLQAQAWENGGRGPGAHISGTTLRAAESWLASWDALPSAEKTQPQPTAFQRAFLASCRAAEDEAARLAKAQETRTKRLRRATIALVCAFIAALGSVVFATSQLAQLQTQVATVAAASTRVAAQATYFGIEQARIGTLSAGAIVIPPGTLTPELLLPTLTGIAQLRQWQPQIITEEVGSITIEMVEVPPGCFIMGSVVGGDEQPIHEQCFDTGFYLDRYEVTQAQFRALAGEMAAAFAFRGENRPVDNITWFEAREYCALRGARLPTEREWEYAARGPDSLTYPWGNAFEDASVVFNKTPIEGTEPVINEEGNPARPDGASWVGALDMSGNVWEWTSTRYDELDYSRQTLELLAMYPYPYRADDGREADETREEAARRRPLYTLRAVRGGSYAIAAPLLRGAARFGLLEDEPNPEAGLRCARSL